MTRTQRARLAALRAYERNYKRTARKHPTPANLRGWADAIEAREAYECDLRGVERAVAEDAAWSAPADSLAIVMLAARGAL